MCVCKALFAFLTAVVECSVKTTSTGPYRSCAALKDISIPLKYLVEFSFVHFGRFWFGLVGMV